MPLTDMSTMPNDTNYYGPITPIMINTASRHNVSPKTSKLTTKNSSTIYTWLDFDEDVKNIYHRLLYDGWIPEYIVGVKRGGLIPAIKLSHFLNKPLIMMSCQLRDSKDNEVRLYEVSELPKDKNILIVDDICDSGDTFKKIKTVLFHSGFKNIKTCALYYNLSQNFIVDYGSRIIDRQTDSTWVVFPWE